MDVSNKKLSKKAVIEVSLHWIFVIVVGAIILTFFITIVVKQKNASEQNLIIDLRNTFASYILGAQTASQGAVELSTFENPFSYSCSLIRDQKCSCQLLIGDKFTQALDLEDSVLFSPKSSGKETDRLLVWSLPWRMPFPATNFVYFSHPKVRYLFVYDPNSFIRNDVETIFTHTLTDKINKDLVKSPGFLDINVSDLGDEFHKIIIIGQLQNLKLPSIPDFLKNEKTVILYVPSVSQKDIQTGNIIYFQYDSKTESFRQQTSSALLGLPSFFGAVFADDVDTYNCAMANAFVNLRNSAQVQLERMKILDESKVCSAFYGQADQESMKNLIRFTEEPSKWNNINFVDFIRSVSSLEQLNARIQNNPCPLLY